MAVARPQPRQLGASASAPNLAAAGYGGSKGDDEDFAAATRPGRKNFNPGATLGSDSVALYATPSYSSLYVDPEDLEPGPGTYDHKGSLGHQHLSTNHSMPSLSLTAKHEKAWSKVMITKDHLNAIMARDTPGPGTYQPEPAPTQARVRFGSGVRQPLNDTHFRAPGPVYEVTGTAGLDKDLPVKTKFGKANRFDRDSESLANALGSTGPGQYETSTAFDGQNLAKSFGASHRAYDRVRFPGSERMEMGRASPGPGSLQPFQNNGKSNRFGREERLRTNSESKRMPGPGAYDSHERTYPFSRNQSVYSFGRPHPKGRIDWKQMRVMNHSTWGIH